ncbi:MAG: alpha/beta fold hydrolase [Flavobacteriales bacterium]|nr:alpha/beta fold hydrolase [Flavobacteriales bacterium]MCB9173070.1 alpha/beta fold hydrolase [Flavobacteriales bacterium]
MKLNYKKLGEGTPLIILHGLFGSLDNWMSIAKELSSDFEVYLVDERNHGQSPHSNEFSYEVMAEDLYEFIQEHHIVNPIVLGHSMGGKTAMQFAMNYPSSLSKLIVADIAPKAYPVHHRQIIDGLLSLNFEVIKTRQEADMELSKHISDISVRQFLLKNLYWIESGKLAWRFNLSVINDNIDMVGVGLKNINIFSKPTLFVRGEKSNYVLDSDFEEIKKIFSDAKIETISNSGHWVHAENPTEFLQIVKSFLMS